ncbi:MAG: TIGR01777 family oxidoreductase [Bacteroidota bacterium]
MTILVAGGTGFIGDVLVRQLLGEGHTVVLLSRRPQPVKNVERKLVQVEEWDGETIGSWVDRLENVDGIINLAGASIDAKRWTEARKAVLVTSRIESTRALVSGIRLMKKRPAVLVNASAVGFYGDVESGDATESRPAGNDFLAGLCRRWEEEAQKAEELSVRVVQLRFGVVLEKGGGALEKMILPFRLFVGGPLGSGSQWFPWVHRDDVIGAIIFSLQNPNISGPVNVSAPNQVTMREFSQALGKTMHRPSWARVPAFVLRIVLGEMGGTVLTGQRAVPRKLEDAGFAFRYPRLDEALRAIVKRPED